MTVSVLFPTISLRRGHNGDGSAGRRSPYDAGRPQSSALCAHRSSAAVALWVSAEDFAGRQRAKYWPVTAVTSGEPAR